MHFVLVPLAVLVTDTDYLVFFSLKRIDTSDFGTITVIFTIILCNTHTHVMIEICICTLLSPAVYPVYPNPFQLIRPTAGGAGGRTGGYIGGSGVGGRLLLDFAYQKHFDGQNSKHSRLLSRFTG